MPVGGIWDVWEGRRKRGFSLDGSFCSRGAGYVNVNILFVS